MKKNIIHFLKIAFPFLAVLIMWHMSIPFWNPAGLLALIPIFYYSFIRPTDWFVPYAAVFCFLIDYKFDTLFFWTSVFCFLYAINGFQNFVDLTRQKNDGVLVFMGWVAISSGILILSRWSFTGLIHATWMVFWIGVLYIPFVALSRRIQND